jgi:hypothetical protein
MPFLSCLVSAITMWLAIWLISRRDALVSLKPVLLISLGVCGASLFSLKLLGSWGLILIMALLISTLRRCCLLDWVQALAVALVWLLSQIAFAWIVAPIF